MTTTCTQAAIQTLTDSLRDGQTLMGVVKALIVSQRVSKLERAVLQGARKSTDTALLADIKKAVVAGFDPLGDAYCAINSPEARRSQGQTFTPGDVVEGMLAWVKRQRKSIARLVDPGAGSGRYTLAGLRAFPNARAVAVEIDPMVAVILRANLAAAGFSKRVRVVVGDFRSLTLQKTSGTTLWIGNPPYVRHHDIESTWKIWYSRTLQRVGHEGSQLAGLHLHFFLKTLELAAEGDLGCYVTAAEWLDVKYGMALRQLLTNGLGGKNVFVVSPEVQVFSDALVSAAITCFAPGSRRTKMQFAEISTDKQLRKLAGGPPVSVAVAKRESKWSFLVKGGHNEKPEGYIELGEIFRVSRGQVTGLNRVWVHGSHAPALPTKFLLPAITDSADITTAQGHIIASNSTLERVVSLPRDLTTLAEGERLAVERFLDWAKGLGAHETYTAQHRKPWWLVDFKEVAPIVMTYMGRRPPVFALNKAGVHLINVAHGLYPRQPFTETQMLRLVNWLNENVSQTGGRIYAGGLTKFEPSEAMRIPIPEELIA